MSDPLEEVFTKAEVSQILRVSLTTVGRILETGELHSFRAGRSIRVTKTALRAYMNGESVPRPPALRQPDMATYPPTPSLLGQDDDDGDSGGARPVDAGTAGP